MPSYLFSERDSHVFGGPGLPLPVFQEERRMEYKKGLGFREVLCRELEGSFYGFLGSEPRVLGSLWLLLLKRAWRRQYKDSNEALFRDYDRDSKLKFGRVYF